MIGRLYRWLRVVMPPAPWNYTMVFCWLGLHGFIFVFLTFSLYVCIDLYADLGVDLDWTILAELGPTLGDQHVAALSAIAFLYGVTRVFWFHPAARKEYRQWLALTPWTSRHPLPVGPLHLVWQDATLLGLFFVLPTIYAWPDTCYGPMAIFIGYAVSLTILNWRTGRDLYVYAAWLMAGGIVLLAPVPEAALVAALAAACLALSGARQSLANFPWEESFTQRQLPEAFVYRKVSTTPIGVPADQATRQLSSYPKLGYSVCVTQAAAISVIFGWITFSIAYHFRHETDFDRGMWWVVLILACAFAIFRIGYYVDLHWWPISLMGRLGTWRWILPGYDRVFLAPLAALGAGLLLPGWFEWFGLPMLVAGPLSIAMALFITLASPPSMENWHYTGTCRLSDKIAARMGQSKQ